MLPYETRNLDMDNMDELRQGLHGAKDSTTSSNENHCKKGINFVSISSK
jgi:hypothetical protein